MATSSPSPREVRAALDRIVTSPQFRPSLRLVSFLRYVVERTLAGGGDRIKSYTIAVEALDRDASFDPEHDAIVRVEAGRLRRALERYYAAVGRDDSVVIDFPRGSYVPLFRRRQVPTAADDPFSPQSLRQRLTELQRQIELLAAHLERAWALPEPIEQRPRRRG